MGFRKRTVMARFGDVTVRRRMYRNPGGRARFPLDERIGLKPGQLASPSVTECLVRMAASEPFRMVVENPSALTACELSPRFIACFRTWARRRSPKNENVGKPNSSVARKRRKAMRRSVFSNTEADGVWVHLQREARKSLEVECAIS